MMMINDYVFTLCKQCEFYLFEFLQVFIQLQIVQDYSNKKTEQDL